MADYDVTTQNEFFTYPSVFGQLAACAKKHDPDLFVSTGQMMDMSPALTLRGLSYASWVLANVPRNERDDLAHDHAVQAVAELSALIARMLEHQNDADNMKLIGNQRKAA